MEPVSEYRMLAFLHWISTRRRGFIDLRVMPREELLELVNEFESGKLAMDNQLSAKWSASFDLPERGAGGGYAAARHVAALGDRRREEDRLSRYRRTPLHAIFLFTSEDEAIQPYLESNWEALNRLSGDVCDIHPSLKHFRGEEDGYSLIGLTQMP